MIGWVIAAGIAYLLASGGKGGGGGSRPKLTEGNVMLRAGKSYRIEIEAGGPAVLQHSNPTEVALAIQSGLVQAGAYDVMVQPSLPILASYSYMTPGDLPIVLNVATQQTIGGVTVDYTFRSVQELAPRRAAA